MLSPAQPLGVQAGLAHVAFVSKEASSSWEVANTCMVPLIKKLTRTPVSRGEKHSILQGKYLEIKPYNTTVF